MSTLKEEKMSGFEKHGLKHVSASQINMFGNCAGAWVARYLYGHKFTFANAARAGVLAEDAVQAILSGSLTREEAIEKALGSYHAATVLTATDADKKRGDAIEGMVSFACDELEGLGKPCFEGTDNWKGQKEIELICNGDGWRMPIKGFLDFVYPHHNLVVDLKTTMRMPSEMSDDHVLQGAIYKKATGMDVKFLYVTGKKSQWFEITDELMDKKLADVKTRLNRMEKFLRLDKEIIKDVVPVNMGSYYWKDDAYIAKELYGI